MFEDLKTYGIVSVLLILVLGYFVYVIYRDNIILKNEMKEIKEFFYNEEIYEDDEECLDMEHEHDIQVDYRDVDEYFSHIKPTELPTIEELPEEVPEEKIKKRKPRKFKKVVENTPIEVSPDLDAEPSQE